MARPKIAEPNGADRRDDVAGDVEPVHPSGGGAQPVGDAVGQPLVQEGGNGDAPVVAVLTGRDGGQHLGQRSLGLGLGCEPALALLAPAPALRVAADVSPVVPGAVAALLSEPRAGVQQLAVLIAAAAAAERRALHC